jgi:transcriptional regulator with AAA-type ATPase domain
MIEMPRRLMPSTLYVLCDARSECLRGAADFIRKTNSQKKRTKYILTRHSDVGIKLHFVAGHTELNEDDDVLIVVPKVDNAQRVLVVGALKDFQNKKVNYHWHHGPVWFDGQQTAASVVAEAKKDATKEYLKTKTAEAVLNSYYKNDEIRSQRSNEEKNLASYIEYRLMYLFIGADTEEPTIKAIITALAAKDEAKFDFPEEGDLKMADLVKQFIEIQPSMAGRTDTFEAYKKRIVALARLDKKVLIVGKTGTGKEAAAYYLHEFSSRKGKKFIPVNCACYTEDLLMSELFGHVRGSFTGSTGAKKGLVEEAEGGTLFLDEIPDAHPRVQAMLLRFLESGEYSPVGSNDTKRVDVKIVAGAQPKYMYKIREDLGYRLKEKIYTYSLKELNSVDTGGGHPDIISMARNLAANSIGTPKIGDGIIYGFNFTQSRVTHEDVVKFWKEIAKPENVELLTSYDWPGNVRDLQTFISRHLCENISFEDAVNQLKNESTHSISIGSKSSVVSFAPINSLRDLIPFYELENLYAKEIRKSMDSGTLKNCTRKELEKQIGLSPNSYKEYILDGTPKVKQTRSPSIQKTGNPKKKTK